ncbi:hypothetical protein R3Q06_03435 [Rhodococcus erythropolis]|nr:hypothetical protein [Rhodococcus erythropolis]MDV6272547.1 hypothetical protein [Rhodococcus erythropolis]
MSFTDEEIAYLKWAPLVRVTTVAPDGQPDVVPFVARGIRIHGIVHTR